MAPNNMNKRKYQPEKPISWILLIVNEIVGMSKNNKTRRISVESKNTIINNINDNKDEDSLETYKIASREITIILRNIFTMKENSIIQLCSDLDERPLKSDQFMKKLLIESWNDMIWIGLLDSVKGAFSLVIKVDFLVRLRGLELKCGSIKL